MKKIFFATILTLGFSLSSQAEVLDSIECTFYDKLALPNDMVRRVTNPGPIEPGGELILMADGYDSAATVRAGRNGGLYATIFNPPQTSTGDFRVLASATLFVPGRTGVSELRLPWGGYVMRIVCQKI